MTNLLKLARKSAPKLGWRRGFSSILPCLLAFVVPVSYSADPITIDDLGFNAVIDENLFSSSVSIQENSSISYGINKIGQISTNLEVERIDSDSLAPTETDNLDVLTSSYQSQGLKIKRLNTSWETESGTLTVGSDWVNFQDFLTLDKGFNAFNDDSKSVSSQIKWLSPNGFSVSLEDSPKTYIYSTDNPLDGSVEDEEDSSSSLILSWQGGAGGSAGAYRVSALRKKFDSSEKGQNFNGDDIVGWGLNLEGGWQIGDLFAALSVTVGNGINSYILQRFGNDLIVKPNDYGTAGDALSIRPSLYYSLNNNSNFHVALGHYESDTVLGSSGIDTLDTIHMGYTWSPWPSTNFGLELVGQNADGPNGVEEESTQVTFGAKKLF